MSSTSPRLSPEASNICDSPKAPNIKKVKLDQCDSAEKPQKDIPRTNVPSTAFLSKPMLTQKSCDVPASAFKVSSTCTSPSNIESFDMDSEGQSCQTQNKDYPMESEPQETQNKDQEGQDSEIKTQENTALASLTDCLKAEEGEEGSGDEAVVDATTLATDIDTQDFDMHIMPCSSDDDVDAMDSQEEGDTQQTQTEESSSCDAWEQLPFNASEVDQSDEIDGNKYSAEEKTTKVNQAAAKDSEGEQVRKKKHGKKKNKKQVDKESKPKKPPPNAFVAVRIPSPDISAKFEEVQRALQEKDERLKQVFVPAARNHITLMVTRLNNLEDVEKYIDLSKH